jgi:prolyl-tRNA synthetase
MLDVYADVAENVMAMPVIKGRKSAAEKFAGAVTSLSIEAMMQNGLALQAGTSHELGQNFGKAFDVKFQNRDGQLDYVWQTSWGVSTRLIGGLVMTHSDDLGLVLPPRLAPVQAVFVPIYRKDTDRDAILDRSHALAAALKKAGISAEVDGREGYTPGSKFFHWEQRGVPLTIELGPRDLAAGNVVLKRRDTGAKQAVGQDGLAEGAAGALDAIQTGLYAAARKRLEDNTVVARSFGEVREILEPVTAEKGGGKFVMAHLKDSPEADAQIKALKASVRCIPFEDRYDGAGPCILTGETVPRRVVIAKAY